MERTFNEKRAFFVGKLEELGDAELLVLAEELLKKTKKGSGIKKDSQFQIFKDLIINAEDGKISEDDMWFKFKAGRHEALTLCRQLHTRVPEGEEAIWAQDVYEGEDRALFYKILGVGAEPPEAYEIRRKPKDVVVEPETATDGDFEAELDSELGNIPIS